jgi:Zn-dependent peptidase ImmA (M78 family)
MRVEINTERLHYLLALYGMSAEDLLSLLNTGRKPIKTQSAFLTNGIELSLLKRIDAIFNKGLSFYTDFSPLPRTAENSVFFRKKEFGTELNLESRKIVDRFETLKNSLDAYSKLADVHFDFHKPTYSLNDDPKHVAEKERVTFHPGKIKDSRQFLKEFINKCADQNIYVFEFIETWNKKERTNIDGVFLRPNVIVLKRQKSYKREIFTLAHELGHCLLGVEEIEPLDMKELSARNQSSDIERWCNNFAFQFIMGEDAVALSEIRMADSINDYCHDLVIKISEQTHISRLAIYTRLYLDKKISYQNYTAVKNELICQYEARKEKEKEKKEIKKGGSTPKPILSRLYIETLQYAFFKGIISETTFCRNLNIKSSKINNYLW